MDTMLEMMVLSSPASKIIKILQGILEVWPVHRIRGHSGEEGVRGCVQSFTGSCPSQNQDTLSAVQAECAVGRVPREAGLAQRQKAPGRLCLRAQEAWRDGAKCVSGMGGKLLLQLEWVSA